MNILTTYARRAYDALSMEQQTALMSVYKAGIVLIYISDEQAQALENAGLTVNTDTGTMLTARGINLMDLVTQEAKS